MGELRALRQRVRPGLLRPLPQSRPIFYYHYGAKCLEPPRVDGTLRTRPLLPAMARAARTHTANGGLRVVPEAPPRRKGPAPAGGSTHAAGPPSHHASSARRTSRSAPPRRRGKKMQRVGTAAEVRMGWSASSMPQQKARGEVWRPGDWEGASRSRGEAAVWKIQ